MEREASPAGSDLEQMVGWLELQLAADAVELFLRGFLQGGIESAEDAAGIGHRVIQPQPEELVAEVVVGADVFAAAGFCIGIPAMGEAGQPPHARAQPRLQGVGLVDIANEDPVER